MNDDGQRPFELAAHAREIGNERVAFFADDAGLVERFAQAPDEIRLAQPGQRRFTFLRRQRDGRRHVFRWLRQFHLRLLDSKQQARNVAFQQVVGESGFLGGAFDEPAALRVATEINLVQVEPFAGTQAQRDFERVGPECFFQTADAIFAAFDVEEPSVAALLKRRHCRRCWCWQRFFLFSRVRFPAANRSS